jgi:hypothetical protein
VRRAAEAVHAKGRADEEIGNPKLELRNKSETQSVKVGNQPSGWVLKLAFLKFEIVSNFGFCISDWDMRPPKAVPIWAAKFISIL